MGIDDKLWSKDDKNKRAEEPVEEAVDLTEAELKSRIPTLFDALEDDERDE